MSGGPVGGKRQVTDPLQPELRLQLCAAARHAAAPSAWDTYRSGLPPPHASRVSARQRSSDAPTSRSTSVMSSKAPSLLLNHHGVVGASSLSAPHVISLLRRMRQLFQPYQVPVIDSRYGVDPASVGDHGRETSYGW